MSEREDAHGGIERRLADIDWARLQNGRSYTPSPAAWDDEVLYFLFVDRFSDGREFGGFADINGQPVDQPAEQRTTPLFSFPEDAHTADREAWFAAGKTWCGGTLAGLTEKIGYLQRLGITAVWLSPIFKQVTGSHSYHGYGIQNFLDIDPHFGTREELRRFVDTAHQAGIRVILDIILNHAGNVYAYEGNQAYRYHQGQRWPVKGFRRDTHDNGSLPFGPVPPAEWPDGAVWPAEFQTPEAWTRKGEIQRWDNFPEYLDGDFFDLKDLDHGPAPTDPAIAWDVQERIEGFVPADSLHWLTAVYKFWIAYADIDGYRIDTVKHMEPGAVRYFVNVIHEFAQTLGKEQFYLIGEVTGGRQHAVNIVNTTGLDAALGINDIPDRLEFLVKGWRSPGNPQTPELEGYFDLFRNSLLDRVHSHQWFGRHVVTMFDDHDQVGERFKFRFCGDAPDSYRFLRPALGLNLTTLGIPCIYYGSEQGFNGADYRTDDDSYSDVFLRECMFGGPFGSLQSQNRHFFNEQHEVYRFVQQVCAVRRQHIALRRGRQYLRALSETGEPDSYLFPQPLGGELRWVVAWSRLFADQEFVCAINTDDVQAHTVWVTIDARLHATGESMRCLLSTDDGQVDETAPIQVRGRTAVQITVPAAGFVIFHKDS